jgi:hypothetical protein
MNRAGRIVARFSGDKDEAAREVFRVIQEHLIFPDRQDLLLKTGKSTTGE